MALFAAMGACFRNRRGLALGSSSVAYGCGAFVGPAPASALLSLTGD